MISLELKQKAINLRKNGKSYNVITAETGISKGMLSYWFSKSNWSEITLMQNVAINREESRKRFLKMNKQKSLDLRKKYDLVELHAIREFEQFKNEPLFIASLMLYFGEGDKSTSTGSVRISNIDTPVLKIFTKFLIKYCDIPTNKIKFWLLSYPDLDNKKCLEYWLKQLNLTETNVYKTQIIQGKHKTKRLLYGVGNIILSNKSLKIKILKWIDLMCNDLTRV